MFLLMSVAAGAVIGGVSGTVNLEWNPVSDSRVSHYEAHYGLASGQYDKRVTARDTSLAVSGLKPGQTYYFATRACDQNGAICSGFSNEVSTTVVAEPPAADVTANVVQNAGFESGTSDWRFYTNAKGAFTVARPGGGSANAAVVTTTTVGSNIQLYQPDLPLQPNTAYRLTFSAFSNTGRDLRVTVQKHGSPYTNYGLYRAIADLGTGWQSFTFDFTTTGFSTPVTDARLMFWFASDAAPGDVFRIDNVSLTTAGASTPEAPSISTGPADQSVASGQTATFAVTAGGTAPLTYQWQKNGVNIAGATGASYTTPATTLADNGALFRCRVTNGAGSVTSGSATVQVLPVASSAQFAGDTRSGSDTLTRSAYIQVESAEIPMQVGEVSVDHLWQRVDFTKSFSDPIVVAKPISNNGAHQATVRVSGVDSQGFWIRVQEWDYLDGWHALEQVSFVAMERGYHQLPDGAWVEAGSLETEATGTVVPVIFTAPFGENPVVFAGVASANGIDAVVTRARDVTREGFAVGMQGQEANSQEHLLEVIHYIAWEPSFGVVNGLRYEVGLTDARVTDQPYSLLYKGVFERPPLFLADMQTTAGLDPANLRWRNRTEVGLEVWVSEEQSKDREVGHVPESVGYFVADE